MEFPETIDSVIEGYRENLESRSNLRFIASNITELTLDSSINDMKLGNGFLPWAYYRTVQDIIYAMMHMGHIDYDEDVDDFVAYAENGKVFIYVWANLDTF